MRRLAIVPAVLAATLAVAPAAQAKEVLSVTACGPGSCATSRAAPIREALMTGGTTVTTRDKARFVRLRVAVGDGQSDKVRMRWNAAWVPSAKLFVGEDGAWMRFPPAAVRAFEKLTLDLGTFPGSRLSTFLGSQEVREPLAAPPPPIRSAPRRATTAQADDGGVAWQIVALPAAALLALAGAALVVRRRRPPPTPEAPAL